MTKAETLDLLLKSGLTVKPLFYFSVNDWKHQRKEILKECKKIKNPYIVRSSAQDEDKENTAGKYLSINNVYDLAPAIDEVCSQFKCEEDQVIIQNSIKNISKNGVAFTADPQTSCKYYTIDYDVEDRNDGVTSGKYITKKYTCYIDCKKEPFSKIINLCKQVEKILNHKALDIEFIVADEIYILQARKLKCHGKETNLLPYLKNLKVTSILSNMADWNPAEMIGTSPKPLALSLYKELITDKAWSIRRDQYGYEKTNGPLLISLAGKPYIDVLKSFHSLLPKGLKKSTKSALLEFYKNKIIEQPNLHDKIEFDIVLSCYTFDINNKLANLPLSSKQKAELKEALINLTNNIISNNLIEEDINKIKYLDSIVNELSHEQLIPYCRKYGTIPFAGLARAAFIGTSIARSNKLLQGLTQSIRTVTSNILEDSVSLSKEKFINKYGHLRPGTYDLESPNYNDGYDKYFQNCTVPNIKHPTFQLQGKIDLSEVNFDTESLIKFIRCSIQMREYAKFVFTKAVNKILISVNDSYYNIQTNQKEKSLAKKIKLPEVILSPQNIFEFETITAQPSFVTNKRINGIPSKEKIKDRILFIESADPGYDWIFSKQPLGLVTMYGGANSHMSIRCNELNIPAVIGCGEKYNLWSNASRLEIDCSNQTVNVF